MRLKLLLTTAAAAGLISGAAMAQTADRSQSSTPPTNDPTTFTDDQCGKHGGPKPCGAQVQTVPIPAEPVESTVVVEDTAPVAETTTTTTLYQSAPPPEVRTSLVSNGPVPDTSENRSRYGGPLSRAGMNTAPAGN